MTIQFDKPKVVRFNDKILILYCELLHLTIRVLMRITMGKKRRDEWFRNSGRVWMSPITGKKLLIKNEQGFRFWVRANTADVVICSTKYEEAVISKFSPIKGDIVIDIGANIGKYTIYTANLVGVQGKVIAIEPFQETFDLLCKNIQENNLQERIVPLKLAIFDKKGKEKIYFLNDASLTNSIVYNITSDYQEVETDTLDSIIETIGIDHVDWLKIDVEGSEYNVLLGAINTLKKNNLKLIMEIFKVNKEKVVTLLTTLGYSITTLESYESDSFTGQGYENIFAKK